MITDQTWETSPSATAITSFPAMYAPPPRWAVNTVYPKGAVVWYEGNYWQKESDNDRQSSGAPSTANPSLWTLISTTQPPSGYMTSPPPYSSHTNLDSGPSTSTPILRSGSSNPISRAVRSFPFNMFEKRSSPPVDEKTDYPSEKDRSIGGYNIGNTAEMLSDKAADSLRYVTIQKESYDARHDDDAFKDELKGKKVWKVGGVGMWAFEHADKHEERKKEVWRDWTEKHGKDEWLKAARARTDYYNRDSHGIKPLLKWKLVERGGNLPDDALPIGHETNGAFLYACRAWWEGGVHLGKAGAHLVNNASISYGGAEHTLDIYEVLCGPSDATLLQWRSYGHGESAKVDGWQPVEGGREKDGQPLFIAKGDYEGGVHPGKCLMNDDHACIGWGGGELWIRPFQVLAYRSASQR